METTNNTREKAGIVTGVFKNKEDAEKAYWHHGIVELHVEGQLDWEF